MRTLKSVLSRLHSFARDLPWQVYDDFHCTRSSLADIHYKIPLTVVQTWETNMFGRTHRKALSLFRASNLAFDHFFLDSASRDQYMESNWASTEILYIYRAARHGVTRADIFRYCYIYDRGGFYTDIAKVPPSPLLNYLYSNPSLVLFTEASGYSQPFSLDNIQFITELGVHNAISPCYNTFFGATRSHKFLEYILEYVCRFAPFFAGQVFPVPRQAILALTGPAAFNYGLQRYLERYNNDGILVIPIHDPSIIKLPGANSRYLQVKSYIDHENETVLS